MNNLEFYLEKVSNFKKLERKLAKKGAENPGGLAAYIGRKKYGNEEMKEMAIAGKKKKKK